MGAEDSWVGKRLKAWGPSAPKDAPDVDGKVVGVRRPGFVDVREDGYDTNTLVNVHGGWVKLTVVCFVLAVTWAAWPDNTYA